MFEGNDDLSFVDDEFLQEVFNSSGTNAVRTKGNENNSRNNKIIPSLSFLNKPLGNQQRKFNGHINRSDSHQTVESQSHKQVLIENECEDKAFLDSVFHLDDNFPYDSPELDEYENSPPVTLTTPPDSEFTKFSNSKLCNDLQVNKVSAATVSDNQNISMKQNDFRSKILQTLKEKKAVHSGSNNCINVSTTSLTHSEKRPNSDTCGTLNNFIPPVKRLNAQTPSRKEGNHSSINESVPSTSVKTQHHNNSNNLNRVHKFPSGQEDISRQVGQSWSSTTPVKSNIPCVRKTVSPGGPLIQKRKFPGPAGILPQPGHNRVPVIPHPDEESPSTVSRTVICSQSSASDFTRGPWQQMISDLELDPSDPSSPLKVFNIKWVVRRAGLRGQAGVRKVPFLAVRVHTLDTTHADATVVLKDPTGEINGTVASTVMDEFGDALQTGSVLILRGVTVLSPIGLRSMAGSGEHARRHYLNITLNTVLTIYTPDETGHVITTTVGNVDKRELHRQAASPTAATEPRGIVEEEEEEEVSREHPSHNKSLFSNMNDSFCNSPGKGSFSFSPQTSVRFPKFTPVAPQQGNVNNFQRVGQQQSQANTSHVRNIRPKQLTPRIVIPAAPVNFPQRKPLHSPQVPLSIKPSFSSTKVSECVPSSGAFSNQAEEKEVKELLSGLDTDSFFDDF